MDPDPDPGETQKHVDPVDPDVDLVDPDVDLVDPDVDLVDPDPDSDVDPEHCFFSF